MKTLTQLFKSHIEYTAEKAVVPNAEILLCHLNVTVVKGLSIILSKVYINTRVLKHLYDKKPAEEFDCILKFLFKIIKYPDSIYKNSNSKRGNLCFVKKIQDESYFSTVEIGQDKLCVVTTFRIRDSDYLKDYELLWSWRGDNPHRNALDSDLRRPTSTPQ